VYVIVDNGSPPKHLELTTRRSSGKVSAAGTRFQPSDVKVYGDSFLSQ
jgi:hypothetical protein